MLQKYLLFPLSLGVNGTYYFEWEKCIFFQDFPDVGLFCLVQCFSNSATNSEILVKGKNYWYLYHPTETESSRGGVWEQEGFKNTIEIRIVPGFSVTISIIPGIRVSVYKLFQRVIFSFGETETTGGRLYLPGMYSVWFLKNGLEHTDYV